MYGIIYTCMHSLLNVLLELKISMTYYLTQTNDKCVKIFLSQTMKRIKNHFIGQVSFFVQTWHTVH